MVGFTIAVIGVLCVLSIYLPNSWLEFEKFSASIAEIRLSVHQTRLAFPDVRHVIFGGDLQEQLPASFAGVTGECCCLPSTELVSERAALLVTLAKDLKCSFASTYANVSDTWWTRKHVGDVEGVTKRQLDYIAGPSTADSKNKSFNHNK